MANSRVNIVMIVAGRRGCGKTTFLKGDKEIKKEGIIQHYLKADPNRKILIIDTFDSPVWRDVPEITTAKMSTWKKGVYRLVSSDVDMLMMAIDRLCFNTVVIFEDARRFVGRTLTKSQIKFVLDSKQKNTDLIFVFHALMDVPFDLVRYGDYITLFHTGEVWNSYLKNKFPNQELERTFAKVNSSKDQYFNETIPIS